MIEYRRNKEFEPEALRELFESVGWSSAKYPEMLQRAMRNASLVISAWEDGRLVGLIRGMDDGAWQAWIDCLLVHKDRQGNGIASRLLDAVLEEYKDILYINVVPEERKNVGFYEKHGFCVMPESTAMQVILTKASR